MEAVDLRDHVGHLHVGVVDLRGGLAFAHVHQLHQEGLLVFGEFLVLSTTCTLLGQLYEQRRGGVTDPLDEGLREDLLSAPLVDRCSDE